MANTTYEAMLLAQEVAEKAKADADKAYSVYLESLDAEVVASEFYTELLEKERKCQTQEPANAP